MRNLLSYQCPDFKGPGFIMRTILRRGRGKRVGQLLRQRDISQGALPSIQCSKCFFGYFIQQLEKRFSRAGWATLALFPTSDSIDGFIDALGELSLCESKSFSNTSGKPSRVLHRLGIVGPLLTFDILLSGGIQTVFVDPPPGQGGQYSRVNLNALHFHSSEPPGGLPCVRI